MDKNKFKSAKKLRRQKRVRAKITGTSKRPRLSVFKSNKGIFLQIIDDTKGTTLVSAHSKEVKAKKKSTKLDTAKALGTLVAKKAKDKKISEIVFDRSGYRYHGRIQAVAEGAREGGLVF